jgi:hypothetical protein
MTNEITEYIARHAAENNVSADDLVTAIVLRVLFCPQWDLGELVRELHEGEQPWTREHKR